MLLAQRGKREEAEAPQTVVEGDQDDSLPGELDSGTVWKGAAAEYERTTMNPHHDRELCSRLGSGRFPHIEKQAIFRGVLRN
jgi:hypothetical protein